MSTTLNFLKTRTATFKLTNDVVVQQQVLDFSLINAASTEKVGAIVIPAGALVLGTSMTVLTPGTSGSSGKLGDEDADTNWQNTSLALDAVANTTKFSLPGDTNPALGGKFYPTATQLSVKLSAHAQTALKLAVTARYMILNAVANAT